MTRNVVLVLLFLMPLSLSAMMKRDKGDCDCRRFTRVCCCAALPLMVAAQRATVAATEATGDCSFDNCMTGSGPCCITPKCCLYSACFGCILCLSACGQFIGAFLG